MYTIQPYFVLATSRYEKGLMMRHGIGHFYDWKKQGALVDEVIAVPDGSVDIVFVSEGGKFTSYVAGTVLSKKILQNEPGARCFGVRFLPGVMPAIVDVSMPELVDREIPLEDVVINKDILGMIEDCLDGGDWINVFFELEQAAVRKKGGLLCPDNATRLVEFVKESIISESGDVHMDAVAENTGYSTRYINRLFTKSIGIPPKTFAKIIRFQNTLQAINRQGLGNLTQLGQENGYYDQSHFILDFKRFTSVTPSQYCKMLQKHDYDHKLIVRDLQSLSNGIE